jgi:hypothetical protein
MQVTYGRKWAFTLQSGGIYLGKEVSRPRSFFCPTEEYRGHLRLGLFRPNLFDLDILASPTGGRRAPYRA